MAADSGVVGGSFTVKRYGVEIDLSVEGKVQCPRCASKGGDASRNNLHCYGLDGDGEHKGAKCFACDYTIPSQKWLEENGKNPEEEKEYELVGSIFNDEVHQKLKEITGTDPKGYRGLSKEVCSYFGVRHEYSEEDGSVVAQYYPVTTNGELVGYKLRRLPKKFSAVGDVGKENDMFQQFRFKTHSGIVLIVGGEVDALSAYAMLKDAQKNKQYDPIAVVSPTVGESGCWKQVQKNFKFFEQFKTCIVALDSDQAGQEAAEKVAKVLPRGRVKVMKMRYKDPNEYIEKGKEQEFISDFWSAKPYTPAGLHSSNEMYGAALEYVKLERLPMPPFLRKVEEMLGGGVPRGYLCMWAAGTSSGKSTVINQALTWWAMNTNEVIGVLSLEATLGELSTNLLSSYTRTKFAAIRDPEERAEVLKTDYVKNAANELFTKEDGSPRFYVCDDRGSSRKEVEAKVEQMIQEMGITVLIVDVLSDILSGLSIAEQEEHMAWQKSIIKEYNVTIHNIVHIRKSSSAGDSASLGAEITEDQLFGTSSIAKSAGVTIALVRNKMADDFLERNTIKVRLLKNRSMGLTGAAGEIFYDPETTVLSDKEQWLSENPQEVNF